MKCLEGALRRGLRLTGLEKHAFHLHEEMLLKTSEVLCGATWHFTTETKTRNNKILFVALARHVYNNPET